MKDRIKKFWDEHEDAILFGFGCIAGVAIGAGFAAKKAAKSSAVTGVDLIEVPNESRKILVFQKNGFMTGFQENISA